MCGIPSPSLLLMYYLYCICFPHVAPLLFYVLHPFTSVAPHVVYVLHPCIGVFSDVLYVLLPFTSVATHVPHLLQSVTFIAAHVLCVVLHPFTTVAPDIVINGQHSFTNVALAQRLLASVAIRLPHIFSNWNVLDAFLDAFFFGHFFSYFFVVLGTGCLHRLV